ncbi:MAG: N-acetyltransferase family protein [Bacteroidota bacterium]
MEIGLAKLEDAPAIAQIFNAYLGRASMVLEPLKEKDFHALIDPAVGYRAAMIVAKQEEDLLGYASVKPWSPRRGYFPAGEVSIFLAEAATGRGIGEALYRALWTHCHRLEYDHLTARIFGTNAGSIRFHEQQGFQLVGVQSGIGLVDGQRVDSVIMEKRL